MDITCDDTFTVAYLFKQFETEHSYDFVYLTDTIGNRQVLRKFV